MKRVKSIVLASVLILFATVFSTPAMAWICTEQGHPPDVCMEVCSGQTWILLAYSFCL